MFDLSEPVPHHECICTRAQVHRASCCSLRDSAMRIHASWLASQKGFHEGGGGEGGPRVARWFFTKTRLRELCPIRFIECGV